MIDQNGSPLVDVQVFMSDNFAKPGFKDVSAPPLTTVEAGQCNSHNDIVRDVALLP